MKSLRLIALTVTLVVLSGCQDSLRQLNKDLSNANNSLLAGRTLAASFPASREEETRVVIPNDENTQKAFEEALPNIKQILAIHKCVKEVDGNLLLNKFAVPGVRVGSGYPNRMRYHNRSRCVSVRAIDKVGMLALNTLTFRVVYFSYDSGETSNFVYQLQRSDSGSWLLLDQRPAWPGFN